MDEDIQDAIGVIGHQVVGSRVEAGVTAVGRNGRT
jgi:hypothetical protein